MKSKVHYGLIIPVLVLLAFRSFAQSVKPENPNIILIVADDMGWGDIGMNGNPDNISTPNLEKIAKQGARFNRFFVSPLCAPTRASLLTGRYHLRTGVSSVTGGLETMRAEEVTLAEAFKQGGYATGIFGKWHNGAHYPQDPNGQGFEEFLGFCGGHWTNYFDTRLQHNNLMQPAKGYITDVLTDAALGFIEKNQSTPFFCYIPYNAPHGPFQVGDHYFNKYKSRNVNDRDAAIYGMVENMDDNIGRVLKKLEDLGLSNNTIIIFLTDNGPNSDRYNGNMKGKKGSVDEGGVRVPLLIRWPGIIRENTIIQELAAHIDIFPTLVDLSGISKPATLPLDGISLTPLLTHKPAPQNERSIFTHVLRDTGKLKPFPGAIRTAQYRYIRGRETDQLYDMISDPRQSVDIADQKQEIAKAFRVSYDKWFAEVTQKKITPETTQVGHSQAPLTELFTPDAASQGSLKYFAMNGYAHDWFTGWQHPADKATWDIEVVEDGLFKLSLTYNCPEGFTGSIMQVSVDDAMSKMVVSVPFSGRQHESPDRVLRIEAYEKDWALLEMGHLKLSKGFHKLCVTLAGGKPAAPFELKSVLLYK